MMKFVKPDMVEQFQPEQSNELLMAVKSAKHQKPVASLLDLPLSVFLVEQRHSNFGVAWNLVIQQVSIHNFRRIAADMEQEPEVGLYIQPFAEFSLN
jgi:hypothetical protein